MRRMLALGAFLAASLAALPICAEDVSPGRSRVRITGSGNNVVLERKAAPERNAPRVAQPAPPGLIDSAADLKASGATDAAVIAYLRAHGDDIPAVIDAEDARRLRKAGAGKSVMDYLARVSAVDIGETGEGHEVVYAEPAPAAEADYSNGIPYYEAYAGGYSAPYPGHSRPVLPRHPIYRNRQTGFHHGRPPFQVGAHTRAEISRVPAQGRMQQ